MVKGLSAIAHGRVQGVGFRYFTKTMADNLGLMGWVRNLGDGTVEILAVGNPPDLERFLHEIQRGPVGSWVEKVDYQWFEEPPVFRSFNIKG